MTSMTICKQARENITLHYQETNLVSTYDVQYSNKANSGRYYAPLDIVLYNICTDGARRIMHVKIRNKCINSAASDCCLQFGVETYVSIAGQCIFTKFGRFLYGGVTKNAE